MLKEVQEPDQQSSKGPYKHKEQHEARYGGLGCRGKEGQDLRSVFKGKCCNLWKPIKSTLYQLQHLVKYKIMLK